MSGATASRVSRRAAERAARAARSEATRAGRDERSDREPGIPASSGAWPERPGAKRREREEMSGATASRAAGRAREHGAVSMLMLAVLVIGLVLSLGALRLGGAMIGRGARRVRCRCRCARRRRRAGARRESGGGGGRCTYDRVQQRRAAAVVRVRGYRRGSRGRSRPAGVRDPRWHRQGPRQSRGSPGVCARSPGVRVTRAASSMFRADARSFAAASLSRYSFQLPHFGDCTQEGQPSSHGHVVTSSYAAAMCSVRRANASSAIPAPPGYPSYTKIVGAPVCGCSAIETPPTSHRSQIAKSGSSPINACSAACTAPMTCAGSIPAPASSSGGTVYQQARVVSSRGGSRAERCR